MFYNIIGKLVYIKIEIEIQIQKKKNCFHSFNLIKRVVLDVNSIWSNLRFEGLIIS